MLRNLTKFVECTGASKAYRDTYLRTPKSRYTGIPVISRTPTGYALGPHAHILTIKTAMIHLQFWAYESSDSLFPISMSPNCKLMSPKHYF